MRKGRRLWFAWPALALLASCGGGGANSPPPSGSAPTLALVPAPTPTPSPPPAPSAVIVPFGLQADQTMALLGVVTAGGKERWLTASDVQMQWLNTPVTFAMTIQPYGSGKLVQDPDNAATSAKYLQDDKGPRLARVNAYIPRAGTNYSVLGASWIPLDGMTEPELTHGSFLYFPTTSLEKPPATGSATYSFGPPPQSQARLAFNFATGLVTGDVPMTWTDAWGPYPEVRYALQDGHYDRTNGSFTATFNIPESGFSGEVRGQIVGSSGNALAIIIRGAVLNPYNSKWEGSTSLVDRPRD